MDEIKEHFSRILDIDCSSSISSVVLSKFYAFVGLIGEESNVNVYGYKDLEQDKCKSIAPKYILENNHGGISKLVLSPCKNLLMGLTCYGWIYIWNIQKLNNVNKDIEMSTEQVDNTYKVENNKNYSAGEITVIKPDIFFMNGHPGDSICVEFINSNLIVAAGINPGSSITFLSVKTGKRIGQYISRKNEISGLAWPMYYKMDEKEIKEQNFELAVFSFTSIAIERSSSGGGFWVAIGGSNGLITLIYLPHATITKIEKLSETNNIENEEINLTSTDFLWKCHQVSELSTEIKSLVWRPRNSNSTGLCLVCGTDDSLLRYCFIDTENKNILVKKINLVKITDGTSTCSEINSIAFPIDGQNNSMVAVGFNRFSSAKRHPIFVTSENLTKKSQSFSSFKVYIQDVVKCSNSNINNSTGNGSNGTSTYTHFYCIGNHYDIITSVYISPCSRYIASSSIDGHLHIYKKSKAE
ncbi:uncharacterized protein cubi_01186 [Cryptosporidium ubiquitum]|uniref:Uncharacterized protein n=1 Tax=Cryptosporidium ubiquitum TaxID=857276 RepID=A0A1J4MJG5_9CRYT|nr:uncharacterized protein cubi_01186 [Cryptosporidium ubiquitum]OII74342.1 hypothetical protein cubi_01186 [Cryptosporidium ubiquitum]